MGAYQPNHLLSTNQMKPTGQVFSFRISLWLEHLRIITNPFMFPESEECIRMINAKADELWGLYSAQVYPRDHDLPGHLLSYPISIGTNGEVTNLAGAELFPDTNAKYRGCFGCCNKPPLIVAVDEPSKGLRIQGRLVKKPSVSDDFWSTSTCEMDNSTMQSQRSVSSISFTNNTAASASSSNPNEFVNNGEFIVCCGVVYLKEMLSNDVSSWLGLNLWLQTRQQWLANGSSSQTKAKVREPTISWNATYESLLGMNKRFSRPIPLPEMVDFLVDVWEQEGLYD
ncbi:hypothetical protein Bca4012_059481 [Brassica carinata]